LKKIEKPGNLRARGGSGSYSGLAKSISAWKRTSRRRPKRIRALSCAISISCVNDWSPPAFRSSKMNPREKPPAGKPPRAPLSPRQSERTIGSLGCISFFGARRVVVSQQRSDVSHNAFTRAMAPLQRLPRINNISTHLRAYLMQHATEHPQDPATAPHSPMQAIRNWPRRTKLSGSSTTRHGVGRRRGGCVRLTMQKCYGHSRPRLNAAQRKKPR